MLNTCAKTVHNWWMNTGTKCVHLSTKNLLTLQQAKVAWVKACVLLKLRNAITTWFSTLKFPTFNLLNKHLYPLSTAPIIIATKDIY